jgi:hypothetical protein
VNLQDEDLLNRIDYGFSTGMLNDYSLAYPVVDRYKFNITNASPNDTFVVRLGIQE